MSDRQKETNQNPEDGNFSEKTNRLYAWVQMIRAIAPFLWGIIILIVILPLLGQFFIAKAFAPNTDTKNINPPQEIVVQTVDWSAVDRAMVLALNNSRDSAKGLAAEELDIWINELMNRVDESFLDWYFGYFNQKQRELKSFFLQVSSGTLHLLKSDNPTPSEKVAEAITRDFQEEFAKRVLRPQIAQLKLERLTQKTVKRYLEDLSVNLNNVPLTYQIPQADWNRYLNGIALSINDTEGNVSSLSMKLLAGGGAYLTLKPLAVPLALKVGSKVVTKMAGKAGAKIATKTGASLAGKIGAELLDPIVGVGIILWDLWDYNRTVAIDRPILRENIADYLQEMKLSILENPENGIMTAVDKIENEIIESIELNVV
ncbi:MAG: hypothetical protein SXA11_00175 [Cyanobacteriota bacterium]|nr:hypothetical protein [Cyanobacteriota bacterium]